MGLETGDRRATAAGSPSGASTVRDVAWGEGWCISELTCRRGPTDRPFEERHERVTIAAVIEGSFQYRGDVGKALLYPGSFLLGNAGTCFECGHVAIASSFFEEIAATIAGSHRFRFPAAMLPAIRELALPAVEAEIGVRGTSQVAMEELVVRLAEAVLLTLSSGHGAAAAPSSRDQRRVSDVLRYVEENAEQPLSLADLADVARMSKYHFLRTFRRDVGVTPYQFLLSVRLRRAALSLCTTPLAVATIAFDAGFGDLSTFNAKFRGVFGMSPRMLRRIGLTEVMKS